MYVPRLSPTSFLLSGPVALEVGRHVRRHVVHKLAVVSGGSSADVKEILLLATMPDLIESAAPQKLLNKANGYGGCLLRLQKLNREVLL